MYPWPIAGSTASRICTSSNLTRQGVHTNGPVKAPSQNTQLALLVAFACKDTATNATTVTTMHSVQHLLGPNVPNFCTSICAGGTGQPRATSRTLHMPNRVGVPNQHTYSATRCPQVEHRDGPSSGACGTRAAPANLLLWRGPTGQNQHLRTAARSRCSRQTLHLTNDVFQ